MSTAPAQLLDDGRITVPVGIRRELGLEHGDYVLIDIRPLPDGGGE